VIARKLSQLTWWATPFFLLCVCVFVVVCFFCFFLFFLFFFFFFSVVYLNTGRLSGRVERVGPCFFLFAA